MAFKLNFFWKSNPENSTPVIQTAILVEMVRMLHEFSLTVNSPQEIPEQPAIPEHLEALERTGFYNTENWKEYNAAMENWKKEREAILEANEKHLQVSHTLHVLRWAREKFGHDTLLIPYVSFEQLMERYNLVCGTFDAYTGYIPLDKIVAVEKTVKLLGNEDNSYKKSNVHADEDDRWLLLKEGVKTLADMYASTYRIFEYNETAWSPKRVDRQIRMEAFEETFSQAPYINSLSPIKKSILRASDAELPSYLVRFPFVMGNQDEFSGKDFHGARFWNFEKGYRLELGSPVRLFICAPAKQMRTIEKVVSPRSFTDPFICAHTNHGILVFTRWGEEADDALIKKYEQVNELISSLMRKVSF